ncbi:unnamed protein product [Arctia plantaginis]|uniref:Uncharacterized protein n=1 Tax=Arctia plantaginis TaxID=874455 RepID=A0A8S0ZMA7_ARCPL|nr:unnamed protein product [Arctia plantaginis]
MLIFYGNTGKNEWWAGDIEVAYQERQAQARRVRTVRRRARAAQPGTAAPRARAHMRSYEPKSDELGAYGQFTPFRPLYVKLTH